MLTTASVIISGIMSVMTLVSIVVTLEPPIDRIVLRGQVRFEGPRGRVRG